MVRSWNKEEVRRFLVKENVPVNTVDKLFHGGVAGQMLLKFTMKDYFELNMGLEAAEAVLVIKEKNEFLHGDSSIDSDNIELLENENTIFSGHTPSSQVRNDLQNDNVKIAVITKESGSKPIVLNDDEPLVVKISSEGLKTRCETRTHNDLKMKIWLDKKDRKYRCSLEDSDLHLTGGKVLENPEDPFHGFPCSSVKSWVFDNYEDWDLVTPFRIQPTMVVSVSKKIRNGANMVPPPSFGCKIDRKISPVIGRVSPMVREMVASNTDRTGLETDVGPRNTMAWRRNTMDTSHTVRVSLVGNSRLGSRRGNSVGGNMRTAPGGSKSLRSVMDRKITKRSRTNLRGALAVGETVKGRRISTRQRHIFCNFIFFCPSLEGIFFLQ